MHANLMPLSDHRMPAHLGRTFYFPIARFLFFETAFIADPIGYFSPLVFPGRHPEYFLSPVPEGDLAIAFRVGAIAMRIDGFQEPYPVFKPEGLIRQCSNGADINHISNKIVVQ